MTDEANDGDGGGLRLIGDDVQEDWLATWRQRILDARQMDDARRERFLADGGHCWPCRDTGYLRGDRETGAICGECERGTNARKSLQEHWRLEQVRLARIPARMCDWQFGTFPAQRSQSLKRAFEFAHDWESASGRGLLVMGDSGVGKTGLLIGALRHVLMRMSEQIDDPRMEHPPRARSWVTTDVDLLEALRDGYADGTYRDVLRRAKTVPLLILDDFGKADYRDGQSWSAERMYEIVNTRYDAMRATWISTNLGVGQLEERLGDMGKPIMSRLTDACQTMTVSGAMLRGGKAAR